MLTAIVDLQFGSTGKGLLAGFLSKRHNYDTVVSANMPNAGHTFVDENGKAWVHKVLPSGIYSPGLQHIMIGPGAVFDPAQLDKEVSYLDQQDITARVVVHPDAAILLPEHKEAEQASLSKISSTMQGSAEAMIQKIRRGFPSNTASKNTARIPGSVDVATHDEWNEIMRSSTSTLVEGSQGYSLGINAGFYPYCTSRDCTVWRLLADAGVMMKHHDSLKVIGSARVHPIRVGNTADGYSGDFYPDQRELSWEELGQTPEKTTVTQRVRRVFSFSEKQIKDAIFANRVTEVFLNFCNYDPAEAIRIAGIIDKVGQSVVPEWVDQEAYTLVKYMGFGPKASDVLTRGMYVD